MKQVHKQRPNYPHLLHCPCGKVYAPTKAEARRLRQEMVIITGHADPCRYYQCGHGTWHWTSQTERRTA
ncbi:hypothetical protein IW252_002610 [Zhihengliuella flava]|uniref:Uncharacterized protein n=1 Tax=Zhihengliuella flava TaxID=1285193 RepID=A0A931DC30_9MICC|nr:hypothetical protein [Zhihengliuella flava]